ncbi:uncharacterized protein LOC120644724 isoform X1 [Panicum virgatum]|uniref:Uncharacterized protein n=1 Tax=Panicum virgatum TaxID=38727 RepID=A0A8T0PMD2_PANVG|nr:uncharacterized protein LOC120644724 isoform X1 [Panicum virgatum]KAG2562770.1 hypothetical protein PVAP13_8KG281140 [Panicum virgatum]
MVCRKRSEHARLQPRDKDGKFCSTSPSLGGRVKHSARAKARRASPSSGGVGRTGGQKSESESDGNSDAVTIPVVVLDDSDSGDDGDSASGDDRDSDLVITSSSKEDKVRLTSRYFRSKHKKKVSTTLGKSSSATSKKKKKEEVTSQGEIRKIWKLQSKIDAKEVKISGLVDTLEKEKAAKLSLERQLAAAQKKASEKWRIPVY